MSGPSSMAVVVVRLITIKDSETLMTRGMIGNFSLLINFEPLGLRVCHGVPTSWILPPKAHPKVLPGD